MKFPYSLVDLTHSLDENTPSWDGGCGFKQETTLDYDDCKTDVKFRVQQFTLHAGIGTHIDAPAHSQEGEMTIDKILLSELIAPCIVLDVSARAHERYSVTVADIIMFEDAYDTIAKGTFVLVKTGWERFWEYPEKYRNNHIFPSISADAASLLLQRNICGLGIDTLSPDRPEDGFPVHRLFLSSNKYLIENAANLDHLPLTGSFIMALPMKIKDATEAPVRLVGFIHD